MRTGAAAGHRGYFHETAFYGSDDELLSIVVPFLEGGVVAEEPTLVTLNDDNAAMVRSALPDAAGITFLPGADQYVRPAATIATYRDLLASMVADGADQIRVVGDVPHPGTGTDWDWWGRYEAVINHAYDDFPLWGICPYDVRITPDRVLDEVARTHPHVAHPGGSHDRNPRFEDPVEFLRHRNGSTPDPLQGLPAALDLSNPTPTEARHAAKAVLATTAIDRGTADDLVVAVSEVMANAVLHGRRPIRFQLWTGIDRAVATVTDAGPGPDDPFVGMLPAAPDAISGRGLWVVHHLCDHVTMHRDGDGFTVRLVARNDKVASTG